MGNNTWINISPFYTAEYRSSIESSDWCCECFCPRDDPRGGQKGLIISADNCKAVAVGSRGHYSWLSEQLPSRAFLCLVVLTLSLSFWCHWMYASLRQSLADRPEDCDRLWLCCRITKSSYMYSLLRVFPRQCSRLSFLSVCVTVRRA